MVQIPILQNRIMMCCTSIMEGKFVYRTLNQRLRVILRPEERIQSIDPNASMEQPQGRKRRRRFTDSGTWRHPAPQVCDMAMAFLATLILTRRVQLDDKKIDEHPPSDAKQIHRVSTDSPTKSAGERGNPREKLFIQEQGGRTKDKTEQAVFKFGFGSIAEEQ